MDSRYQSPLPPPQHGGKAGYWWNDTTDEMSEYLDRLCDALVRLEIRVEKVERLNKKLRARVYYNERPGTRP